MYASIKMNHFKWNAKFKFEYHSGVKANENVTQCVEIVRKPEEKWPWLRTRIVEFMTRMRSLSSEGLQYIYKFYFYLSFVLSSVFSSWQRANIHDSKSIWHRTREAVEAERY